MKFEVLKKIKFNRFIFWQISVVAFLVLFSVVLSLNIFSFIRVQEYLNKETEGIVPSLNIDIDLLNAIVDRIEEKRVVFDKMLLKKSSIKDPSL